MFFFSVLCCGVVRCGAVAVVGVKGKREGERRRKAFRRAGVRRSICLGLGLNFNARTLS